jgi:hypothetical protein
MRAQRVHVLVEGAQAAGEGVQRRRRGEVGGVEQALELRAGEHAGREHLRSAVVERQAFLVRQRDRLQPRAAQGFRAGHALALVEGLAATEQHDRQVRERREVAAGADRALLRHHRHDAGIEQGGLGAQGFHADARVPAHQRVDADHQHRPHDLRRERLADADGVGDDQVALQFLEHAAVHVRPAAQAMRAEQLVGVAAEAGRDAVDRLLPRDHVAQEIGRALHVHQLRLVELDRCAVADGDDLGARQRLAVESDHVVLRLGRPAPATSGRLHRALLLELGLQRRRQLVTGHLELLLAAQVLDRHHATRGLVLAHQHHEADAGAIGVLELPRELLRLELHFGVDPAGAQQLRERERVRQPGLVDQADERVHRAVRGRDDAGVAQLEEQPRQADGNAHARQLDLV